MADKGIKYIGANKVKSMALGSQEGHKLYLGGTLIWEDPIIEFDDEAVKAICVNNWGGGVYDDEITEGEAAKVTSLAGKFRNNTTIEKFNELRYFSGLTSLYISGSSTNSVGEFYGCTALEEVQLPAVAMTNLSGAFRNNKIAELDLSPLKSTGNLNGLIHNDSSLVKVIFPGIAYSGTWAYTFRTCTKLANIEIKGTADLSGVTLFNVPFYGCAKLETITGTLSNISNNISFADSPLLTHDSLLVILNGLADLTGKTSKTLTLHTTAKARLTEDDMAIAQNKNWQIE